MHHRLGQAQARRAVRERGSLREEARLARREQRPLASRLGLWELLVLEQELEPPREQVQARVRVREWEPEQLRVLVPVLVPVRERGQVRPVERGIG